MIEYSTQKQYSRKGRHAETIDSKHFKHFLKETTPYNYDIMLEIKDKEKSALKAAKIASKDNRFTKLND